MGAAGAGAGSDGFEGGGETGAGWLVTGAGSVCCCCAGSFGAVLICGGVAGAGVGDDGVGEVGGGVEEEGGGTEELEEESESLRTYTSVFVLSPAPASPRDPRPRPPRPLSDAPRPVGCVGVGAVAGAEGPGALFCGFCPRPAPLPTPPRPRPRSFASRDRLSGL